MQYSSLITLVDARPQAQSDAYDVAIIGAGISSAYTLIHYINELERVERGSIATLNRQPVKIIVTEKSGDFWTGMPYGNRSGRSSLLITCLKEFLPQTEERQLFIDWLAANRDRIFDPEKYRGGELSQQWLADNTPAMDRGEWDELFLPRHTFGLFIKERMERLITTATANGTIAIDLIAAEAHDVRSDREFYYVDFNDVDGLPSSFVTKKLVLAIGSPPNLAFDLPSDDTDGICYIDNMYEPSLDANLERLSQALATARPGERQVAIVGSNASTLDVLYSINNYQATSEAIEKYIAISPNAAFPHRISREVVTVDYTPHHLVALAASTKPFTAKQILTAVCQDVDDATARQINISDIYGEISKYVIQCMEKLSYGQQKQFVSKYAVEIGKFQRRAGWEYLDVVDALIARDKMSFVKGKFVNYLPQTENGSGFEYVDSDDRQTKTFTAPLRAVINCAGFQDVTRSTSPLIQNLLRREICQPNESNRGFVVDKNFTANRNCYVMGPLVAGNIDGSFRIWHAESCQRIYNLSQTLAKVLIESDASVMVPDVAPELEAIPVMVNAA